jgi:ubiquinone/menaquinone biosynthesis C-methylase UbiE
MEQSALAARQFGAAASAYLTSPVHAQGEDLRRLTVLAQGTPGISALDLGCGAGHAGFALAQGGAGVNAYDLSPEMLAIVGAEARRRGLARLQTRQGPAERLPFPDASFDLVVTRYSAHHWSDVPAALREAGRVLRPGGRLVAIDVVAPESPLLDTVLQTAEFLRDASHVRDYRVSEWAAMFQAAGFRAPVSDGWSVPAEFQSWIERMGTPELRVQAIRDVFERAPDEARTYFQVRADGSFALDVAWLEAGVAVAAA